MTDEQQQDRPLSRDDLAAVLAERDEVARLTAERDRLTTELAADRDADLAEQYAREDAAIAAERTAEERAAWEAIIANRPTTNSPVDQSRYLEAHPEDSGHSVAELFAAAQAGPESFWRAVGLTRPLAFDAFKTQHPEAYRKALEGRELGVRPATIRRAI